MEPTPFTIRIPDAILADLRAIGPALWDRLSEKDPPPSSGTTNHSPPATPAAYQIDSLTN